jgi:hypothetical protein
MTQHTTSKVRLPELSLPRRVRLWFRYQRYAFALIGLPTALVAISARTLPWWAIVLVSLVALAPVRFGIEVWSRYPRKVRATRVALARIEAGTFSPASIKRHCGDPCFRLVADEILTRASIRRAERKLLIKRFSEQLRKEDSMLVLVDHVRGTVLTLGGDTQER